MKLLKELQNYKQNLFLCPPTKIGENTTNILKQLFFILILHFVTSYQICTHRKLNLPLRSSIYFVYLHPEIQKSLEQTKVYRAFSYFVWKETTQKPLKVAAVKTLFSNVYIIATTLMTFHENLSLLFLSGMLLLSLKPVF